MGPFGNHKSCESASILSWTPAWDFKDLLLWQQKFMFALEAYRNKRNILVVMNGKGSIGKVLEKQIMHIF